ncbi:MAG TPA: helix-turn-helix transcriptional regulator [Kribbella sp.]|uniref:helix-turn-helix domain-containing protein n=1 Tax=Kribbella sp. TaxID=1871183 RepID=UPI002D7837F5|nr:helix-turn-helix transcriptional regulator [Kribbella sp.]HET6293404.1 helix-turn-helix transcriptional regulator [Kribbella sp.]
MEISSYEREQIANDLRAALREAGLTQEAFARLLGTSRPRLSAYLNGRTMPSAALHQRALRAASGLSSARRHGWMTPDRTSKQVNEALRADDEEWAFKLVIQARDQLAEMLQRHDPAVNAWLLRSTSISDPRYDALLSALVEHEFDQHDHPLRPEWTNVPRLERTWLQPNARRGADWTRAHTPQWLAKRGIYISTHDLKTA